MRFGLPAAVCLLWASGVLMAEEPKKKKGPQVEVVFCIDTTGSMGKVLETMSERVFSICGQIKAGKPAPDLKVGLVAYKDKKDEYVTKITSLTSDLDKIYDEIKKLKANGGGDTPESVNKALHDAIDGMGWNSSPATLKLVFVIGDAPPHMDYDDDVKYPETCKLAVTKHIVVNTIACGTGPEKEFAEIAKLAKGEMIKVPQTGGKIVEIPTPHDKRLAAINAELIKLAMPFGPEEKREAYRKQIEGLNRLSEFAAADRAVVESRRGDANASDLAEMVAAGQVKLEDVPADELPAELKKLPAADRAKVLAANTKQRQALLKEAGALDTKRVAFLIKAQKEAAKKNPEKSFDQLILETLRKQARRHSIFY